MRGLQPTPQHTVATPAPRRTRPAGFMLLDACAVRSLELLSSSEGRLAGSLRHVLDRAATPAGRRKVKAFVTAPLYRQVEAVPGAASWQHGV